jgi:large subunit ribosomal protein L4e
MADKPKAVKKKKKMKVTKPSLKTPKKKVVAKAKPVKTVKPKAKSKKAGKKPKVEPIPEEVKPKRVIPDKYEPGNLKVNLYGTNGKVIKEIPLPKVFDTEIRFDLIRKDVKISRANRRQRYGPNPGSGMRHAVSQWGKGRGTSRVQRLTQGNTAAESPPNVGGRRAHPPRPEHDWSMKMNYKERRYARNSAIASTADSEVVRKRGHKFGKKVTVPIVIEDEFANVKQTRKVIRILERLKIYDDVLRAEYGRHVRTGRGKTRGRRYKTPKSLIIVVPDLEGIGKGARNLPGVEIVTPESLNTEVLAPGGDPGRLAVFTESAVKVMGAWDNV